MKTIKIVVDKTGKVVGQTDGFKGGSCLEAGRKFWEALGVKVEELKTSEYYQSEEVSQGTNLEEIN